MLTEEQREFLVDLQEELNTQDTVCQADPRFWVVLETFEEPCWDDQADDYALIDDEGNTVGHIGENIDAGQLTCVPVHKVRRVASSTMFLTLRECREHIKANDYHYRNPQPYAMTAWRSPQVEKLVQILQTADWDSVEVGANDD